MSQQGASISPSRTLTSALQKGAFGFRNAVRARILDTIDMNTSSVLKRQVAEQMESDNRTAVFELLATAKVSKEEFFDAVMFAARQLLTNNNVHECFMLLRSSHDRAVQLYKEPIDYQLFEEIGNMYNQLNQPKESIKWYNILLEKDSTRQSIVQCNIGLCYMKLRDLPQAIEAFLKSVEADEQFTKSWMNLGQCYIRAGQVDKAIFAFNKIPISSEQLSCIGNAHHTSGNYEEAIASYLKALDIGEDPGVLNNLGCSLKALGLIEDAIVAFNDSLVIEPRGDAAFNLIVLYIEIGSIHEAKQLIRSSKRIIPSAEMKQIKTFYKEIQRKEKPADGPANVLGPNLARGASVLKRSTLRPMTSLVKGVGAMMAVGAKSSLMPQYHAKNKQF